MSIDPQKLWAECGPAVARSGQPFDHYRRSILGLRDTLPQIFLENQRRCGGDVAMRRKDLGIWHRYTWSEIVEQVRRLTVGIRSLGIRRGDKISVIGDNDPEWYWTELAILSLGAVCIGLYIDAMPEDIAHVVTDSETVLVFAKDQEQVDKFLALRERIPAVRRVVYWDSRGMALYTKDPWLMSFSAVQEEGRARLELDPEAYEREVAAGRADDLAIISYTSGTTSLPKGVMLSQAYLVKMSARMGAVLVPQKTDNYLSFIPPAWITEQLMIANWLIVQNTVNFPEKPETIMSDLRETRSFDCRYL